MFDLKNFREHQLKMTQSELADLIGERQDKISRLEKNPSSIGLDILINIADKTGTTLDELVNYKKVIPEALEVDDTWDSAKFVKETIIQYVVNSARDSFSDKHKGMVEEISNLTRNALNKPKVAIVGLSDTGKSTLINSLIGDEKMPSSWTPTTAISVYIKHINDKPSFIKDEVWFFKSSVNTESGWNPNKLNDENYCNEWVEDKGDIRELSRLAVRRDVDDGIIGSAVVFIDSPILKVCDIVDLPGYNTGDRELDNQLTEQVGDYADVLIYMSLANGFMRGNDIEYVKSALNYLPVTENHETNNSPLSNIFVIASQAHAVNSGNRKDLNKILDEGAKRLYSQIPEEIWDNRSEETGINYNIEVLRKRFFTYTKDIEDLRNPFEQDFTNLVEGYPKLLIKQYKIALEEMCDVRKIDISREIKEYQEIISKREEYVQLVKDLELNEPRRRKESERLRKEVLTKITDYKKESITNFSKKYNSVISVDSIIGIIDEKVYKNKKADMKLLCGFLNSKIQATVQNILKEQSLQLSDEIDKYLAGYDVLIKDIMISDQSSTLFRFDTKRVFASGLAGLATFGGLAVWASTLGNLGAYILLAKGVSLLSAIGISVTGGTAGAAAAVAAIGGPVVLGIALAVIAAVSIFAIFGTGWKKTVAKKIVKAYSSEGAFEKYSQSMNEYWNDTETAFNQAANNLETNYKEELAELNEKVNEYDIEKLEESVVRANSVLNFFEGMPSLDVQ